MSNGGRRRSATLTVDARQRDREAVRGWIAPELPAATSGSSNAERGGARRAMASTSFMPRVRSEARLARIGSLGRTLRRSSATAAAVW